MNVDKRDHDCEAQQQALGEELESANTAEDMKGRGTTLRIAR